MGWGGWGGVGGGVGGRNCAHAQKKPTKETCGVCYWRQRGWGKVREESEHGNMTSLPPTVSNWHKQLEEITAKSPVQWKITSSHTCIYVYGKQLVILQKNKAQTKVKSLNQANVRNKNQTKRHDKTGKWCRVWGLVWTEQPHWQPPSPPFQKNKPTQINNNKTKPKIKIVRITKNTGTKKKKKKES